MLGLESQLLKDLQRRELWRRGDPPSPQTSLKRPQQPRSRLQEAEAACRIQRWARAVSAEGATRQRKMVADMLRRKRHERQQRPSAMQPPDAAAFAADPNTSDQAGEQLEQRLKELQRVVDAERWRVERLEREQQSLRACGVLSSALVQ